MLRKAEDRAPRTVAAQPHGPAATITRRAADRLRAGHLWVYRSDVESLIPLTGSTVIAPGALTTVTDSRGLVAAASSAIKLYKFNAGGLTQLTDADFTGNDLLFFSGRIPLG